MEGKGNANSCKGKGRNGGERQNRQSRKGGNGKRKKEERKEGKMEESGKGVEGKDIQRKTKVLGGKG